MTYTLVVVVMPMSTGGVPSIAQVGTYSSLNVAQTEKELFIKEIQTPMPGQQGPQFAFHVSIARKT